MYSTHAGRSLARLPREIRVSEGGSESRCMPLIDAFIVYVDS